MNDREPSAEAKIVALTAAKNVLLKYIEPRQAARILQGEIVEEIRKLSNENMSLVREAIDYAQDEIVPDD